MLAAFSEFIVVLCSGKHDIGIAADCESESRVSAAGNIRLVRRLLQHCSAASVARCLGIGAFVSHFAFYVSKNN